MEERDARVPPANGHQTVEPERFAAINVGTTAIGTRRRLGLEGPRGRREADENREPNECGDASYHRQLKLHLRCGGCRRPRDRRASNGPPTCGSHDEVATPTSHKSRVHGRAM